MGRSRDEVSGRWEGVALRETHCERAPIAFPRCDQYDGFAAADGNGTRSRAGRRPDAGDGTYPEGETADVAATRVDFGEARTWPPQREAKACEGRTMQAGYPLL